MARIQRFTKFLCSINSSFWVTGATVLSFAFATYHLGYRSLSSDEAVSVFIAQKDWPAFWATIIGSERYQHLYLFLLKLWIPLGDDETTVRLLSVFFSTASIPVIYLVGKALFDSRVGTVASFLLGVNAFFIYYAQNARAYALLLFLTLCSSWFAIRCIKHPSRKSWAGYTAFSVFAVYAHYFGGWIILAHAVSLFFLPRKIIDWKGVFYSGFIIGMSLLPLLFYIAYFDVGKAAWIPRPTLFSIANLFHAFTGWPLKIPTPAVGFIYGCVYFFLCIIPIKLLIRSYKKNGFSHKTWRYAFILCWFFLPIILVFGASMVKPIFIYRYLIIAQPGFILLVAVTLAKSNLRWITITTSTVLVIFSSAITIYSYTFAVKQNWRGLANIIEPSLKKEAAILIPKWTQIPFEYSLNRANKFLKIYYINSHTNKEGPEPTLELVNKISQRHQKLWLILVPNAENLQLESWVQKYYIEKQHWQVDYWKIVLYLKRAKPKGK